MNDSVTVRTVHCQQHGDNREAFMCEHLLRGRGLGFCWDIEDTSNPYPDAWCPGCEQMRGPTGDFDSDYARATFRLVCGACYEEIKAKNVA